MLLADFKALLLTADPLATKYKGALTGNYTAWTAYARIGVDADNRLAESGWKVQVDRFTKSDSDAVVALIDGVLSGNDEIGVNYLIDYESDTGYIHHIWDCVVV